MSQERQPEAGKYKHNDAEHRVRISDRDTCSLVCFVLQCGPKRYLTPQLLRFSFFFGSDCSFTCSFGECEPAWQKDFDILAGTTVRTHRANGTRRGTRQRKMKETVWRKSQRKHVMSRVSASSNGLRPNPNQDALFALRE